MVLRFILVAVTLVLLACGDDTETIRVTDRYTLDMLDREVSLTEEKCDSARIGQLLYVGDSSGIFYCTGKVWKKVNGNDGKDGRDGKDGTDGADGKRGKYGTSGTECYIDKFMDGFSLGCGATKAVVRYNFEIPDTCKIDLRDDFSYVLTCGDDSVKMASQGPQGKAGDICRQTDIGGGQVRLVCGNDSVITYKAQCGEIPFDPDGSQFCYGDTLVERCNMQVYDIKKQFCYGDSIIDFCEGRDYDPKEQFCYADSLLLLCGEKTYDLETHFCDDRNGKIYKYKKIGGAVWMVQHLDYKVPNSFCASPENDDDLYCGTGRLYPWTVAVVKDHSECGSGHLCPMTYPLQGVCPDGWHLPTKAEWEAMMVATGSRGASHYWDESVKLFHWGAGYGLNTSGFSALPVGIIPIIWNKDSGLFERTGKLYNPNGADFWTSTEYSKESVHSCYIFTDASRESEFDVISYPKDAFARLVRCVRD